MSLSKVIEVARGELGQTEDPAGSNLTKYGEAYGGHMNGQPWCVMFLWWVFDRAGERMAFFGGGQTASCSILLRWYREQGLTVPVWQVQKGDIVLLNFHRTQDPEHCGLVIERNDESFITIEGNTSPGMEGSQHNGGCVAMKTRYQHQIVGVCRPHYKEEEAVGDPKDDIAGHWAEEDIRWCVAHGLMKGYPDGSFGPDRAVTRAELAAVLRRLVLVDQLAENARFQKIGTKTGAFWNKNVHITGKNAR